MDITTLVVLIVYGGIAGLMVWGTLEHRYEQKKNALIPQRITSYPASESAELERFTEAMAAWSGIHDRSDCETLYLYQRLVRCPELREGSGFSLSEVMEECSAFLLDGKDEADV